MVAHSTAPLNELTRVEVLNLSKASVSVQKSGTIGVFAKSKIIFYSVNKLQIHPLTFDDNKPTMINLSDVGVDTVKLNQ